MKNFIIVIFLLFSNVFVWGGEYTRIVKGKVVSKGTPLKNVVVTDGNFTTQTNEKGQFVLEVLSNSKFVYITTPSGYLPIDSLGVPKFFQRISPKINIYNFELLNNRKNDYKHLLLVHADPQFFKEDNFQYYSPIVEDCKKVIEKYNNVDVFGLDCGDLVGDKPDLYPKYINELSKTKVPFYRVIGNHDMNYYGRTDETSTERYSNIFGPTYYSFNRGKIHYIVLDNIFYIGRDYFYMGYISEKMFQWLEKDLSYVPKGSTVFVSMHIPARLSEKQEPFTYNDRNIGSQTVNATALFAMLEPYKAHILTGHMHTNSNMIHSPTLYEHNTSAICGTWWQGKYALDGTPLGYGVYEINGDDIKWYYKSSGYTKDYQMRVYGVGENDEYPKDITVNIWNWDKNWKVIWFENDVNMGEMTRFEGIDPEVKKMCADKEKLDFKWITPIKNNHMFRATPKNKDSKIKIQVIDAFGKKYITYK